MTNQTLYIPILFDIDKTLLDTETLVQRLNYMISDITHTPYEQVNAHIDEYISSLEIIYYFDFITLVERLPFSENEKDEIIHEFENNRLIYPRFIDAVPTLRYLHSKGYQLGIFSEGTPRYQENKLKNLRVDEYIDNNLVFIGQSKRTDEFLSKIPKGSAIVDDNIEVIHRLVEFGSFRPIYLQRDRTSGKVDESKFETIVSLDELRGKF